MPQHILNEDYKDYRTRKYLEKRRDNAKALYWIVIIGVIFVCSWIVNSIGLSDNENFVAILGWAILIIAIYAGAKAYLRYNIPKRNFTQEEIWRNNY